MYQRRFTILVTAEVQAEHCMMLYCENLNMDSFESLLSISNGPPIYNTAIYGSFLTCTAELAGINQNN